VLENRPLDALQAVHLGVQAADALAYLHRNAFAHGDLTPDTFLIGTAGEQRGHLWLLNAGLAQVEGRTDLDVRSDLGSFGATLYESLSGHRVVGPSATTGVHVEPALVDAAIPPLQTFVPEAPEELSSLIMWCLEKRPEDRPDSFREVAEALGQLLRECPADAGLVEKLKRRLLERRLSAVANKIDSDAAEVQ
jgi:serine/threonine-protein kinase